MDSSHITFAAIAAGEVSAALACIVTLTHHLPEIAAGLAIIWYVTRFVAWLRRK